MKDVERKKGPTTINERRLRYPATFCRAMTSVKYVLILDFN